MLGIIWWCSSDLSSTIWSSQSKYFLSTVKKNQNKFFFILKNKIYMSLFQESFFAMHSQHAMEQILQRKLLCHCANLDIIQLMIDLQPLKAFPSKKIWLILFYWWKLGGGLVSKWLPDDRLILFQFSIWAIIYYTNSNTFAFFKIVQFI